MGDVTEDEREVGAEYAGLCHKIVTMGQTQRQCLERGQRIGIYQGETRTPFL